MKTKKAQTDIIVTVLLVLIALAAVAAIAYFIMGQVRGGTDEATNKANCLKLDFEITKAINSQSIITIKRNDDGSVGVSKLTATVSGSIWGETTTIPSSLSTENITKNNGKDALVTGNTVEVGAILTSGGTCPSVAKTIVTAA